MAAALPKDPPRPAVPKTVMDPIIEAPLAAIPAVPKQDRPKPASRRRPRSAGGADDRSVRARANDKDLSNEQALAIAAAEAAAAEHKDGEVDKSLMQEEVDTVDARRSSEFKALPEEIRERGDSFLRSLERSRVGLISEKELLELAQPFFRDNAEHFPPTSQTNLIRTTYNKWTVIRQRSRRKLFALFRHNGVNDLAWMTDERALCLASRFYLKENEVTPTEQEVKRMKALLAAYLDPEQQRQVTRVLKEASAEPV